MRAAVAGAGLLLLLGALPVGAATPDIAYAAYQTGHYRAAQAEALRRIEANPNDAAAMTLLGEIYRQGLGVKPDQVAAMEWYEQAARRGDVNAVYALAVSLLAEDSPRRDVKRGGELMRQAAEAGQPSANYNLALALLATGEPADAEKAARALEIAARANIGDAAYALGILYEKGRGVPQSAGKATEWLAKAAAEGNTAAEIEYGIRLFNGDGVAADEEAAARWFLRAAYKGNPVAQNRIARLYQSGRGIAPDSAEAAAWHLAARAQGVADPQLDLLVERLNPEQLARVSRMAADRIESTALTAPGATSK